MRTAIISLFILFSVQIFAQEANSDVPSTSALSIGGYGEAHFNQALSNTTRQNGTLDVHRIVMFLGYQFSEKTQFVSEIEFEHTNELYVEQAYIQHKLNKYFQLQTGLLLVPMGIVNISHEPTTFNGVERTFIDSKISPTTWRQIGAGLEGNIPEASIKYQLYVMNGLNSYLGESPLFDGTGVREGRIEGGKFIVSSPNIAGRIQYYGVSGLNLGLSYYGGKSQSSAFDMISNTPTSLKSADSTSVNINMLGLDYTFNKKGFESRAQIYYTAFANSQAYNQYFNLNRSGNALGAAMYGYYIEMGYNVLKNIKSTRSALIPFVRYQSYDTQIVNAGQSNNLDLQGRIFTAGLTYKITSGVVVKADMDFAKTDLQTNYNKTLNLGFGVNF